MLRLLLLSVLLAPSAAAQTLVAEPAGGAPAPFVHAGTVTYQHDDGAGSVNVGPPSTFDPDMLWGNYYHTQPGGEVITQIAVAFGPTFPSGDGVTFWLLDDPDADGDPRNATSVASVFAVPTVAGNTAFVVDIPPTLVGGGFFVGASAPLTGGQDRPARLDTDSRADRSWLFYDGVIADVIDDLASAAFGTRMDDASQVPFPGAWMIRAVGEPMPVAGEDAPGGPAALYTPAPNPSAGSASVAFALARAADVRLDVVDALGRTVAVLADGARGAGAHRARVRDLAPGVYVVRLVAGGTVTTRPLTVGR